MKGNKQCREDYIKAEGERRQLSSVQGVSATNLSKRIISPFVVVEGTVFKIGNRLNAGPNKTEFIAHISFSTYYKLLHVNPHKLESLQQNCNFACSEFVI